jgi:hypothetical protein
LDYDVVEDFKKMKANITVFELCNITQLREQLRDALKTIQTPQDVVKSNSKNTKRKECENYQGGQNINCCKYLKLG